MCPCAQESPRPRIRRREMRYGVPASDAPCRQISPAVPVRTVWRREMPSRAPGEIFRITLGPRKSRLCTVLADAMSTKAALCTIALVQRAAFLGARPRRTVQRAAFLGARPRRTVQQAAFLSVPPTALVRRAAFLGVPPTALVQRAAFLAAEVNPAGGGSHGVTPSIAAA